ncbi:LysR family transcriptional regulator [Roseomonas sp. NAR14]|uniref:LysR family transcriptional regulator n=1 Tax=Roseomonas acroporae TaxID=2937791 RepID=A0A9X2BWQ1_9PROT|nr:LysR family transcriptional regulator [Roseomonas acroporae]MCK8788038.1 LysR family transcriptional regulator [Roseomonas acroporae]
METRFLETFLTVVESGSISEGARRSNLTPAGVTQRLRALEAEIGVPLLVRAGRGVTATRAGSRVAERARPLLRACRDLTAGLDDDVLAGELRLGAVTTAAIGLLPDLMVALRAGHPGIEIRLHPGRSNELYAKVLDAELDAAMIVQPGFGVPKTCGWLGIRAEPLIVLVPDRLRGADPFAVLAAEPFIRYDERSWGGKLAGDYLRARRIRPREIFELETLDAIAVLVNKGLGVSLVPDWAPPWPSGLSLARLPVPGAPLRHVGLLWQRASVRIGIINAVVEQFAAPA